MKTFLEKETGGFGIGLHGIRRRLVFQTEIADRIIDVCVGGGAVEKLTPRRAGLGELAGGGILVSTRDRGVFLAGHAYNLTSAPCGKLAEPSAHVKNSEGV